MKLGLNLIAIAAGVGFVSPAFAAFHIQATLQIGKGKIQTAKADINELQYTKISFGENWVEIYPQRDGRDRLLVAAKIYEATAEGPKLVAEPKMLTKLDKESTLEEIHGKNFIYRFKMTAKRF